MSARPRRSEGNKSYQEVGSDASGEDSEIDRPTLTKKKPRKSTASSRKKARADDDSDDGGGGSKSGGRKGKSKAAGASNQKKKLQWLLMMPPEIHSILTSGLSPADLYHLSLTCKTLRATIQSLPQSHWKRARKQYNLPTLSSLNGMTELQYAHLVFGTKCQNCGRAAAHADYYLRRRMCKDCRKTVWARLTHTKKSKELHPATTRCVTSTKFSPTEWNYAQAYIYVAQPDVDLVSSRLFELEAEDKKVDAGSEAEGDLNSDYEDKKGKGKEKKQAKNPKKKAPLAANQIRSSLLEDYIQKRMLMVTAVEKDAKDIQSAYKDMKNDVKKEKKDQKRSKVELGQERREAIEERVSKLEGYTKADFKGKWATSTLVNKAEILTDDIWEQIQPSIVKLITKLRADKIAEKKVSAVVGRQNRLLPHFNKLKSDYSEDTATRSTYPIFADFLNLPSVMPFWNDGDADDVFDKEAWEEVLDTISEEVEARREVVRLSAIKTIISAILPDEPLDEDSAYTEDLYDKAFFDRPTSFLFCTLPNCRPRIARTSYGRRGRRGWGYYFDEDEDDRVTTTKLGPYHFSSFHDLCAHQHSKHQSDRLPKLSNSGHFELPPHIFDTMACTLVAAEKSLLGTTKADLGSIHGLKWLNGSTPKKRRTLNDLLDCMYSRFKAKPKGPHPQPIVVSSSLGKICGSFDEDDAENEAVKSETGEGGTEEDDDGTDGDNGSEGTKEEGGSDDSEDEEDDGGQSQGGGGSEEDEEEEFSEED